MSDLDLHQIGVGIVTTASIVSLILLILKGLGKELEATALVWIRVWRKIQAERNKVIKEQAVTSLQPAGQEKAIPDSQRSFVPRLRSLCVSKLAGSTTKIARAQCKPTKP